MGNDPREKQTLSVYPHVITYIVNLKHEYLQYLNLLRYQLTISHRPVSIYLTRPLEGIALNVFLYLI